MENVTVIRVGEKNNFNQTDKEFAELKKYENKGKIFVNSNAFNPINSSLPSIITINPYMEFVALTGDLSNVKAVRIKIFQTGFDFYKNELQKCVEFCSDNNLPILLTYMRYKSIKTALKYTGENFRDFYKHDAGYFRPKTGQKLTMKKWVNRVLIATGGNLNLVHECDGNGNGCPDCMNCSFLTFGIKKNVTIKALNLSISGINDPFGRRGLCPYHCPDCFAKLVTFGKRPQCDKLITNKKINGEVKARKMAKKKEALAS